MSDLSPKPRIKIVSDGTPWGTKIIDMEDGKTIPRVVSLQINIESGGKPALATLKMYVDELDFEIQKSNTEIETYENT